MKLVIVTGYQGSGKSTLAKALADKLTEDVADASELNSVQLLETSYIIEHSVRATHSLAYFAHTPRRFLIEQAESLGTQGMIKALRAALAEGLVLTPESVLIIVNGVWAESEGIVSHLSKYTDLKRSDVTHIIVEGGVDAADYREHYHIDRVVRTPISLTMGQPPAPELLDTLVSNILGVPNV